MNCTCNRNHVDDDEHAPTCAFVLSAQLAQLREELAAYQASDFIKSANLDRARDEIATWETSDRIKEENLAQLRAERDVLGWIGSKGWHIVVSPCGTISLDTDEDGTVQQFDPITDRSRQPDWLGAARWVYEQENKTKHLTSE